MAERKLIIEDVIATLETITTLNGYSVDFRVVEIGIRHPGEVQKHERPYCGVAPDIDTDYTSTVNGVYDVRLPIVVAVVVDGVTGSDRLAAIDGIESDLRTALRLDPRRGGVALSTHPTSLASDEPDPAKREDGYAIFRWMVEYQVEDDNPTEEERVLYADLSTILGGGAPADITQAWAGSELSAPPWVLADGTWRAQGLALNGFSQPTIDGAILRYIGTRPRLLRATWCGSHSSAGGQPHAGIATRSNPAVAWVVSPQSIRAGGGAEVSGAGQALVSLQPNAEIAVFLANLLTTDDVTFFGGLVLTEV